MKNLNINPIALMALRQNHNHSMFKYFSSFAIMILIFTISVGQFVPTVAGLSHLGCLNPMMFKMPKSGAPLMPSSSYDGADRSSWYSGQTPTYPMSIPSPSSYMFGSYPQQPMKRLLFQPKWASGLFGGKGWMGGGWKMMNNNFYRPGYGYSYPTGYAASPTGGYPMNELNVAPFSIPQQFGGSYVPGNSWSLPASYSNNQAPIHQSTMNIFDSYSPSVSPSYPQLSPKPTPVTPIVDPFSKKGGTSTPAKLTTTKNLLIADGGYNIYDAHLIGANLLATGNNYTNMYGYTYPDWYSGVVESPARIAQQLLRINLRKQRLQQEQAAVVAGNSRFPTKLILGTSQDEPRFVGFGTVDVFGSREARLSCSFNEAIDQMNRPIWVKFLGSLSNYSLSDSLDTPMIPTFNCGHGHCSAQQIDSIKDGRIRIENGPATSTLIITEPKISDYGVYRCSALTKSTNNSISPLETIYQIVKFGDIK